MTPGSGGYDSSPVDSPQTPATAANLATLIGDCMGSESVECAGSGVTVSAGSEIWTAGKRSVTQRSSDMGSGE